MWDVLCDAQIWSCLWVPDFVRPGILRLSGAPTNEFEQRSEISNAARATNRPPSANQCRCVTAGSGRRPVSAHSPSALAVRTPPPSVAEHRVVTALPSLSDHTPGQISRPEPSRQGFRSRKSASQNSRIMRQTHLRSLFVSRVCFVAFSGASHSTPGDWGRAVLSSLLGPGSDLSEAPVFRIRAGHAGLQSRSWVSSRTHLVQLTVTRRASAMRCAYTRSEIRRFNDLIASLFVLPSLILRS